jgi:hypothetical protein
VTLPELLANATQGPWRDAEWGGLVVDENENPVVHHALPRDAPLIALAPDLARLALDMGEELRAWLQWSVQAFGADEEVSPTTSALLARLDALARREARDDG